MTDTITQTQIIQSLGEHLALLEKELGWGVRPAELRHFSGRIGELYVAMITRGQMAVATNQKGYDVVGGDGEHISVKTITSRHPISFKDTTLHLADRVIVILLQVDDESGVTIEEIWDETVSTTAEKLSAPNKGSRTLYIPRSERVSRDPHNMAVTHEAKVDGYLLKRFENGSIEVALDGVVQSPAKPVLRALAAQFGVMIETANGRLKTTHQLGSHVISAINARTRKQRST